MHIDSHDTPPSNSKSGAAIRNVPPGTMVFILKPLSWGCLLFGWIILALTIMDMWKEHFAEGSEGAHPIWGGFVIFVCLAGIAYVAMMRWSKPITITVNDEILTEGDFIYVRKRCQNGVRYQVTSGDSIRDRGIQFDYLSESRETPEKLTKISTLSLSEQDREILEPLLLSWVLNPIPVFKPESEGESSFQVATVHSHLGILGLIAAAGVVITVGLFIAWLFDPTEWGFSFEGLLILGGLGILSLVVLLLGLQKSKEHVLKINADALWVEENETRTKTSEVKFSEVLRFTDYRNEALRKHELHFNLERGRTEIVDISSIVDDKKIVGRVEKALRNRL